MSNIFEIDGDIEDNNDDENRKPGDENQSEEENANDSSLPVEDADSDDPGAEIIAGDESNSGENDEDGDIPWYDKVLSGEEVTSEESNDSDQEANETEPEEETEVEDAETPEETDETADESFMEGESDRDYDDITEEEISETLHNIDLAEEATNDEMAEIKEIEEDEKPKESFDEIFPKRATKRQPLSSATIIFASLFIAVTLLLCYYQFYNGHSFEFTFAHRSAMEPGKADSLHKEYELAVTKNREYQRRMQEINASLSKLESQLQAYKDSIFTSYGQDSTSGIAKSGTVDPGETLDLSKGTFYQIQLIALGSFEPKFEDGAARRYVEKENNLNKLLLGAYTSESAAKNAYEALRKSGFADAFIVKKVNGKRVPYRIED